MKYYSFANLVGIRIDDNYPWADTLALSENMIEGEKDYLSSSSHLSISYSKKLDINGMKRISETAFFCDNKYVDTEYGVLFEKEDTNNISLIVSQECNEWLIASIELLLLQNGMTFIHAAGVEKDSKALLFPSWSGVGKTALIKDFIKANGWKLMGDDLIVISNNKALPFLKDFVIYPYYNTIYPELFSAVEKNSYVKSSLAGTVKKVAPLVKKALRSFPKLLAFIRKHNPDAMHIKPGRLYSDSEISAFGNPFINIWLERTSENDLAFIQSSVDELLSRTVSVSLKEVFSKKLPDVINMCCAGIFDYNEVFTKAAFIIGSYFKCGKCYSFLVPEKIALADLSHSCFDAIKETIETEK